MMTTRLITACRALSLAIVFTMLAATPLFAADTPGQRAVNALCYPVRAIFSPATSCFSSASCGLGNMCRKGKCEKDPDYVARDPFEEAEEQVARKRQASDDESSYEATWQNENAVAACGADRRCRIDRLKRRNEAKRYQTMLLEEERARQTQESLNKKRQDEKVRLSKRISADFYVTFLGPGVALGYALGEKFHLDATLTRMSRYIYDSVTVDGTTTYIEGSLTSGNIGVQGVYFLRTGSLSPYLSAGALLARGSLSPYYFDDFGFGGEQASSSTVMHIVQGSLGLDYQAKIGFRSRLGLMLRQSIYSQASYSPGSYDTATKDLVDGWFKQNQRIGLEFSLGWAF